jgi:hypothetical protein
MYHTEISQQATDESQGPCKLTDRHCGYRPVSGLGVQRKRPDGK